jgi:hypothetical protein
VIYRESTVEDCGCVMKRMKMAKMNGPNARVKSTVGEYVGIGECQQDIRCSCEQKWSAMNSTRRLDTYLENERVSNIVIDT